MGELIRFRLQWHSCPWFTWEFFSRTQLLIQTFRLQYFPKGMGELIMLISQLKKCRCLRHCLPWRICSACLGAGQWLFFRIILLRTRFLECYFFFAFVWFVEWLIMYRILLQCYFHPSCCCCIFLQSFRSWPSCFVNGNQTMHCV